MKTKKATRRIALTLAVLVSLPVLALPASAQFGMGGRRQAAPPRPGMTTKKKLVLLAGAALLYYLYRKHQAANQQAQAVRTPNGTMAARRSPQLYRSRNGGVYYRDPQTHRPTWVTAPAGGVQVAADDVQRYAPNYSRYRNMPVPSAPRGYATQSATEFDPDLAYSNGNGGGMTAPRGPRGPM